jgi:hypothetical protein
VKHSSFGGPQGVDVSSRQDLAGFCGPLRLWHSVSISSLSIMKPSDPRICHTSAPWLISSHAAPTAAPSELNCTEIKLLAAGIFTDVVVA